jgi:hypothetical protein
MHSLSLSMKRASNSLKLNSTVMYSTIKLAPFRYESPSYKFEFYKLGIEDAILNHITNLC